MIQRKRRETKKNYLRNKRRCHIGRGERQRRRKFGGQKVGDTEEEARDKEEEIL